MAVFLYKRLFTLIKNEDYQFTVLTLDDFEMIELYSTEVVNGNRGDRHPVI